MEYRKTIIIVGAGPAGLTAAMAALLAETAASRVFGLGRWGEWQHYNTDVVVERSLALSERLASARELRIPVNSARNVQTTAFAPAGAS